MNSIVTMGVNMYSIVTMYAYTEDPQYRRFLSILVEGDPIDYYVKFLANLLPSNPNNYYLINTTMISEENYNKLLAMKRLPTNQTFKN